MLNQTQLTALQLLYAFGRAEQTADLRVLAEHIELSCRDTDRILGQLESVGLVDADRVRLTLAGLTVAVACPNGQGAVTHQVKAA